MHAVSLGKLPPSGCRSVGRGFWTLASRFSRMQSDRHCVAPDSEQWPVRLWRGGDDLFFRINLENKINCIIYGCVSFGNKLQGWGTRMERLNGRDKLDCLGVLF